MSVRIRFVFPATAVSTTTKRPLSERFAGTIRLCEEKVEDQLSDELMEVGIMGGEISGEISPERTQIVVTFWTMAKLPSELREVLTEDVRISMMDGHGESGFELDVDEEEYFFDILDRRHHRDFSVEEAEDEREMAPKPLVAMAAKGGDVDRLRMALQSALETIDRLYQGFSALDYAITKRSIEMIRMLLEAKADPNVKNMLNGSPLRQCAAHGFMSDEESCEIAKLLLDAGADPDAKDSDERDAAQHAKIKGKTRLVKLIQDYRSSG
jgi:hypothetical protein